MQERHRRSRSENSFSAMMTGLVYAVREPRLRRFDFTFFLQALSETDLAVNRVKTLHLVRR